MTVCIASTCGPAEYGSGSQDEKTADTSNYKTRKSNVLAVKIQCSLVVPDKVGMSSSNNQFLLTAWEMGGKIGMYMHDGTRRLFEENETLINHKNNVNLTISSEPYWVYPPPAPPPPPPHPNTHITLRPLSCKNAGARSFSVDLLFV